jgi:hypothetical protein
MGFLRKLTILLLLVSPAANATLITIDAADFASGETITAEGVSFRGIVGPSYSADPANREIFYTTLSSRAGSANTSPYIFAAPTEIARTFSPWEELLQGSGCYDRIVAGTAPDSSSCFSLPWAFIEITLASPTTFVEAVGGFSNADGGRILAFDSDGNSISCAVALCSSPTYDIGSYGSMMITSQPLISTVRFGARLDAGSVAMSRFTFDDGRVSVPEPGGRALDADGETTEF